MNEYDETFKKLVEYLFTGVFVHSLVLHNFRILLNAFGDNICQITSNIFFHYVNDIFFQLQ